MTSKARLAGGFSSVLAVLVGVAYSLSGGSAPQVGQPVPGYVAHENIVAKHRAPAPSASANARIDAASCRISVEKKTCKGNYCTIETSWGSGTLIAPRVVITCSHVFDDGGEVKVHFAGKSYPATLVKRDPNSDLARLAINAPVLIAPTEYVDVIDEKDLFNISGFGGGSYLRTPVRYSRTESQRAPVKYGKGLSSVTIIDTETLVFTSENRSGDSGGGVFNSAGQLVAVQWGGVDGETYATGGRPLVEFLWGSK